LGSVYFECGFLALDYRHGLVFVDAVAFFLQPFNNLARLHARVKSWHYDTLHDLFT